MARWRHVRAAGGRSSGLAGRPSISELRSCRRGVCKYFVHMTAVISDDFEVDRRFLEWHGIVSL
ncbi:hypothetical protein IMZ48_22210 [Candidatus Bathyarchaeota archaeon]|nr:hypothetical protein [Candidatus Bathyarchaeota archaeon]